MLASKFVRVMSYLCFTILIITSMEIAVSPMTPPLANVILFCGVVLAFALMVADVLFMVFAKGVRLVHAILGAALVFCLLFSFWANQWHAETRRRHFLHKEMPVFQKIVERVKGNRGSLSSQPRQLNGIAEQQIVVSASTNLDGSLVIRFPDPEAGPRHGYLYYSGDQLKVEPGDADVQVYHLTNGWYEY